MLELHNLHLSGWMSYANEEILLSEEGITYIQGKVGAGKSAVLEAIFYLLTGQISRKKSSINDFENKILKSGYDIWLEFSVDGKRAVVREIRNRTSKDKTMFGVDLDQGLYFFVENAKGEMVSRRGKRTDEARKNIKKFVKMSINDLSAMAIILQRQKQDLVEGTPSKRAGAIVELFSLEQYDDLIRKCSRDINSCSEEYKALRIRRDQYVAELEDLRDKLLLEPPDDFDPGELEEVVNKIKDANDRLDKLRDTKNEILSDIKIAKQSQERRSQRAELEKEISDLEEALGKIDLDDSRDYEGELRERQYELRKIESEIDRLSKDIAKIKEDPDNCPITNEECPVGVPKEKKAERLCALNEKISKNKAIANGTKSALEDIKPLCSVLQDKKAKEQKLSSKRFAINKMGDAKDVSVDINKCNEKIKKCDDTINRGKTYLSDKEREKEKLIEARGRLAEFKRGKQAAEEAIKKREKDLEKIEKEIETLGEKNKYLIAAGSVFERARLLKIDLVLELLNTHMESILSNISDGEMSAKFVSAQLDSKGKKVLDKIDIIVADSNKTLPIGMWSGGQITQVGLGVLLSVFKTARGVSGKATNFLWMDEPFGPLDDQLVDKVFSAIRNLGEELDATSIKIISHRDLDSRVWDHKWDISMENGISNLSRGQ